MSEVILVGNPRRKRRKVSRSNPRRKRRVSRSNPRRKRRVRRNPIAAINPRRRRARRRYASNPKRKSRRARRRSSARGMLRSKGFIGHTVLPAGIGALGAMGTDLLLGYLPLPSIIQGPAIRPLVRIAAAVGVGMLAGFVTNKRNAEMMTAGAVTVIMYDTLKGFAKQVMPSLPLSAGDYPMLSYINAGMPVGEYVASGTVLPMGEYVG